MSDFPTQVPSVSLRSRAGGNRFAFFVKYAILVYVIFDGNTKSKRVQEKCGFRYHHTAENVPCAIPGVLRTEHITCLEREEWEHGKQQL